MMRRPPLPARRSARLRRFAHDCEGVAVVEFALIAPVLILLYFGLAQLGLGLTAQRRVSHAASAVGDLAAQADVIDDDDRNNIFAASTTMIQPFDAGPLQLRITSMTVQDGKTGLVNWSEVKSPGQADLPVIACKAVIATIPTDLPVVKGDNLIMAEAVYRYHSPISYLMASDYKFAPKVYLPPRRNAPVQRVKGATNKPACP